MNISLYSTSTVSKKVYINQAMDERVVCHTNKIEGAWKHAKEHIKRMSGTQPTQFEGHLAEVMWRSEVKRRMYVAFLTFYDLSTPWKARRTIITQHPCLTFGR